MTTYYVQPAELDLYLNDEFGAVEASLRLADLESAEEAVDAFLHRSCRVAGSASARSYPAPEASDVLRIDDCTTITGITVMGTALSASDYQPEPVSTWERTTRPYEQVRLLGQFWPNRFPGERIITVTATWGWSAVPAGVVSATKIIAKDIIEQRRVRGNMVAVGDMAGFVRQNATAVRLLRPLQRPEAFAAVA